VGHAQEQSTLETADRRICEVSRSGNNFREHSASTLPAQQHVGEGFNVGEATVALFRKYADKYAFDYLMLVALGYQESLLYQRKKNPSGAVGIM
jgi:soluble lytic murein transglycosylase-like protein